MLTSLNGPASRSLQADEAAALCLFGLCANYFKMKLRHVRANFKLALSVSKAESSYTIRTQAESCSVPQQRACLLLKFPEMNIAALFLLQ